MTKDEAILELAYLLYDVSNPNEWDLKDKKEWLKLQESVAKLLVYVKSK